MGCGELCCMHVRSGEGWHPVGGGEAEAARPCWSVYMYVPATRGQNELWPRHEAGNNQPWTQIGTSTIPSAACARK